MTTPSTRNLYGNPYAIESLNNPQLSCTQSRERWSARIPMATAP